MMSLHRESEKTRSLLRRLFALSFVLPLLSWLLVWLYFAAHGEELSRAHWRHVVLIIWLATLAAVTRDALRGVMPKRRPKSALVKGQQEWTARLEDGNGFEEEDELEPHQDSQESRNTAERMLGRWERGQLLLFARDAAGTAVMVPALAGLIVYVFALLRPAPLDSQQLKTAIAIVWLGTLLCLLRNCRRAAKDKLRLFER